MKRLLCIFLGLVLFFTSTAFAYADDAILGGAGKTVYPITSADIRMVAETVNITVDGMKSFVDCEFIFKNEGKAITIEVGFPENVPRKDWGDNTRIYAFKASVDGKACAVTRKKGSKPVSDELENLVYPYWHTFKVRLEKNQTVKVKNSYWTYNTMDSMGGISAGYILKTGAVWKGPIGKADINLTIKGFMPYNDLFASGDESYAPSEVSSSGVVKWRLKDFEPMKDIYIYTRGKYDRDMSTANNVFPEFWKHYNRQDYKNAKKYIDRLEKEVKKPENSGFADHAYIAAGAVYYYNGEFSKALAYLGKCKEKNEALLYYRTLIFQKTKKYPEMKAALNEIIKMTSTYTNAFDTMGKWAKEKYKEYEKHFKE